MVWDAGDEARERAAWESFAVGDWVRCADGRVERIVAKRRPPETVIGHGILVVEPSGHRIFWPSSLTKVDAPLPTLG